MKVQAIANARATIHEGVNLIVKARLVTDSGVRLSHDGGAGSENVTAASYKVYDLDSSTPDTVLNSPTSLTDTTVFTSHATGYLLTGWDKDGTGYNFAHVIIDGTNVTWRGGHRYRIDYTVTTAATISPGAQVEGPLAFSVYVKVLEGF